MKKFVLIVAGGIGNRMKNNTPKQFIEINGRPILMHTFDAFLNYDAQVEFILVLPETQTKLWENLCKTHNFIIEHKLTFGGETRFNSVKNGLDLIQDEGIVFIHDGVRPLVSKFTIQNCYEMALKNGNALPVIPVSESVRWANSKNSMAVNRSEYFLVQTPQTFMSSKIKKAYQKANSNLFTDDASVIEAIGEKIYLTEGNRENIKITFPEDLVLAKAFLSLQFK